MLQGVRKKAELEALGLSGRLVARLGVLLGRRLEVTRTILEHAQPGGPAEALLLDPLLIERADRLDAALLEQLSARHGLPPEDRLGLAASGEWRTLALAEELAAEAGFADSAAAAGSAGGGALAEPGAGPRTLPTELVLGARPGFSADLVHPSGGPGGLHEAAPPLAQFFSPTEIARLKLIILTSTEPNRRIEAMRTLAFAPLPVEEQGEVFTKLLTDEAPPVRAEAAQLLVALGLAPGIARLIRRLESTAAEERLLAVRELAEVLRRARPLDSACAAVVLLANLRTAPAGEREFRRELLCAVREVVPTLSQSREQTRALLELLLSRLPTDFGFLQVPTANLLVRLGELVPRELWELVEERLGLERDRRVADLLRVVRARLAPEFILAAPIGETYAAAELDAALAAYTGCPEARRAAAELAAALTRAEPDGLPLPLLGEPLRALPEYAVPELLERFDRASVEQQKYLVRLLDALCQTGTLAAQGPLVQRYLTRLDGMSPGLRTALLRELWPRLKARTAEVFQRCLAGAATEVRLAVLLADLPADPDLDAELRQRLAEGFLENLRLFGFASQAETAEYTLLRMGLPVGRVLLRRAEGRHAPAERARAARLLGELAGEEAARGPVAPPAADFFREAARRLARLTLEPGLAHGPFAVAAAQIAGGPFADDVLVESLSRGFFDRRGEPDWGAALYEVFGYLGASPYLDRRRLHEIVRVLRDAIEAEGPAVTAPVAPDPAGGVGSAGGGGGGGARGGGEALLEFTPGASHFSDVLPAAIRALARIGVGEAVGAVEEAEVGHYLIGKWERVLAGRTIWGPAPTEALAAALERLGVDPRATSPLRRALVAALARRLEDARAIEALGRILGATGDDAELAGYAGELGQLLLERCGRAGSFSAEERPVVLRALARVAGRRLLETRTARTTGLRERILEVLGEGLRDGVEGVRAALAELRDAPGLPDALREEIERRLTAHRELVLHPEGA